MYRIAIACEGPADRIIIQAILDSYVDDYEVLPIQPPISALGAAHSGEHGGGWRGLLGWCNQEGPSLHTLLQNSDILIIQIDCDVAYEGEDFGAVCPPPDSAVEAVRDLVLEALGIDLLPPKTILCAPGMASETWAMVALFPQDPRIVSCAVGGPDCIECRLDVKALLYELGRTPKPSLVVRKDGKFKNQPSGYSAREGEITAGWPRVLSVCELATRFDAELRMAL